MNEEMIRKTFTQWEPIVDVVIPAGRFNGMSSGPRQVRRMGLGDPARCVCVSFVLCTVRGCGSGHKARLGRVGWGLGWTAERAGLVFLLVGARGFRRREARPNLLLGKLWVVGPFCCRSNTRSAVCQNDAEGVFVMLCQ